MPNSYPTGQINRLTDNLPVHIPWKQQDFNPTFAYLKYTKHYLGLYFYELKMKTPPHVILNVLINLYLI